MSRKPWHTLTVGWDPEQYLRYSDERALPFRHLVAAVNHPDPGTVVDLGCGPGALTAVLMERWPAATIVGVDASPEMITLAKRREISGRLEFTLGDAMTWRARKPVDLLFSNACFHWIDDHHALLDHLLPQLAADGMLAFQVPANHHAPSHTILRDLCSGDRWRRHLDGMPRTGVREVNWYLDELGSRSLTVNAWQTTYHHVLSGHDPVLEWVKGTTLRPVLDRLPNGEHARFLAQYGAHLREAYPSVNGETTYPFTRLFVVALHHSKKTIAETQA